MENGHTNIIGELSWSRGQRLICSISTFREKTGLDIRLHYFDPETKNWHPTQKGIRVPIEKAKDFHGLIMKAFARLSTYGVETTQPSGNDVHLPPPPIEPGQPSVDTSGLHEGDPKKSEPKGENGTDVDPEERINDWLGHK